MTMIATSKRRLGLLGASFDPVGQLLEDLPEDAHTEYFTITEPLSERADVDEFLVLSQSYALAHLPALIAAGHPCRVLLRRAQSSSDQASWVEGLNLLCNALAIAQADHITLHALTAEAAAALSDVTNQTVTVLAQLKAISGERPVVPINRKEELITFSYTEKDGTRSTRQARLDGFSWVRLRRLGKLFAADPNDLDMADVVAFAEGVDDAPSPIARKGPATMVVVVPNGVGLGHVTRMMAIGKALNKAQNFRVVFWCFSRAAAIVQAAGFEVILRQTGVHLDAHPPDWRRWETVEFAKALRHIKPDVVAYDGAAFDRFVINALRTPGCGRSGVLWVRRGMMRADTNRSVLDPEQFSDLVLEPGDLAVAADQGPTRTAKAEFQGFCEGHVAPPVTLKPYLPAYTRREAQKRLGLRRGKYCLVSLGGAFGNWDELLWTIKEQARLHRITLIWAQSPLSPPPDDSGDTIIRQFYPLSPYLEAFNGVITATGYNSFHELVMGYQGPVILAPTNLERLDDQEARATYAAEQGWADVIYASRPEEHRQIIADFMRRLRKGEQVKSRPSSFAEQDEMCKAIDGIRQTYA
ncbi:glycosyltransferase [Yoonia litorea]|uniref:UDP:flavonoid glycosyltransferase YjiC, YdhE family n=1 Tax=Yoonia litorea TaxID=1123755 RepID=A0A1I6N2R9_9RHOB|nr:hypothetical protein [Yoonia litorea]SFS22249.1 UDP:flavonoid glycosyltransferase YjiC, YdhE family [Yoonia litorea]